MMLMIMQIMEDQFGFWLASLSLLMQKSPRGNNFVSVQFRYTTLVNDLHEKGVPVGEVTNRTIEKVLRENNATLTRLS